MSSTHPNKSLWDEFRQVLNGSTATLFGASLFVPMAAFMLYPFLIIYFTHVLGYTVAVAGLLLSVRFLSSGLFGFLGGVASSRLGLANTYLVAGLLTSLSIFLLGYQTHIVPIVVILIVLGVSSTTVNAMARSLANEKVREASRGSVQNYIHWLNNVGMAAALPISALALGGGYSRLPFLVAGMTYAVMALVVSLVFRSPPEAHPGEASRGVTPWTVLREDRAFVWLLLTFLLVVFVEMQFESGVPLDLSYHFIQGAKLFGVLGVVDMAIVFVLQLVVSRWLFTRKSPWWGYAGIFVVGGLIVGGLWQTVAGWTISIVLLGIGDVFAYGQIFSMMGILPKAGRQGSYFSILGMVQGIATFLAYGLGSILYQTIHAAWMFGLCLPIALLAAYCYRNARLASLSVQVADDQAV